MSNGLCARCGSSGYGCYECTPKTYTRADMEAAIKRALEEAAKRCDAELINTAMLLPYPLQSSAAWNAANCIRALDPAQFIEEPKP